MTQTGQSQPLRVEQTIVRLVRRADRRQIPTRRRIFRGGRRIEDAIEALEGSTRSSESEDSVEGRGSAIVMGWASRPAPPRSTAAKL
jgi:hypothetical protein